MRIVAASLVLVSLSFGQWVETTIPLPDSLPKLNVRPLVFHSPNHTVYVGGAESFLMAINAETNTKLDKVIGVGPGPHHYLCSDPVGNKLYCANRDSTITVIDCATNQPVKTLQVWQSVTDLLHNPHENKLYCASTDSLLAVVDCATDSLVARIPVSRGASDLCYNPRLNRVYCSHSSRDEVSVIDCVSDTVVATIWVRGIEPLDICYDSLTDCVYTANTTSGTVSVIDCAGDSLVRVVTVGSWPEFIIAGPPGKVYCSNYADSSVSVVSESGVRTVRTVRHPYSMSYDPVNNKVYCTSEYDEAVTIVDAAGDSVVARVGTGSDPWGICHNPVGNNTYVACAGTNTVEAIGGASNTVEAGLAFGTVSPSLLCYNTASDRLYCADPTSGLLLVIDGNTHAVREVLRVGRGDDVSAVRNQFRNNLYVTSSIDATVSVIDGATDRIVARIAVGGRPQALCYNSANDRVYVAGIFDSTVSVIDCAGDTVVATMHLAHSGGPLTYNSVSNKVYCLNSFDSALTVIDGSMDTVAAVIELPDYYNDSMCFIPPHNKLYVSGPYLGGIVVVDGARDILTGIVQTSVYVSSMSYDLGNDRVYGMHVLVPIIDPATDSQVGAVMAGPSPAPPCDNGRYGEANRVYCADVYDNRVQVVSGTADTIIRSIAVGENPAALAWNPAHSWMYVACGSGVTVLRDTLLVGIEESSKPQATSRKPEATIARGLLVLGAADSRQNTEYRAELLDVSGRKVLDLKPGANDVRALAPGVYFIREAQAQAQAQAIRKVVVTR
jgi:YVTN family beta-propeller protein